VLLVIIACILAVRMKALLIGESAMPADQDAIVAALTASPAVERVIHIRTLYFSPEELMVAAKLAFAPDMSVAELASAVDEAEAAVRASCAAVSLIYIEPDLYRSPAAP